MPNLKGLHITKMLHQIQPKPDFVGMLLLQKISLRFGNRSGQALKTANVLK